MKFLTDRQVETLKGRLDGEREDGRIWNYLEGRLPALVEGFVEEAARRAEVLGEWEERERQERAEGDPQTGEEFLAAWKRVTEPPPPGEPLVERQVVRLLEGLPPARRRFFLDELGFWEWHDPPRRVASGMGLPSELGDVSRAFLRGRGGRFLQALTILEAAEGDPGKTELLRRAPKGALGEVLDRFRNDGLIEFHEKRGEGPGRPPVHVRLTEKGRSQLRRWRAIEIPAEGPGS